MIPKKIYQTWENKDIPDKIQQKINEMMEVNPEYSHELYDDSDRFFFIKENYGKQVSDAYESLNLEKFSLFIFSLIIKSLVL